MDLKEINRNYKKKSRNSFEILQYQLYINIPNLKEQLKECENIINKEELLKQEKAKNIADLYLNTINSVEDKLKDILEVKRVTLKDLKNYIKSFSTITRELEGLNKVFDLLRQHILEEDKINNGVVIFRAETTLFLIKSDIDLIIEKISKK